MNRRAQAGSLIGIIVLLLVFYILFLPPEERRELLDEDEFPGDSRAPGVRFGEALFQASPGQLTFLPQESFEHFIPNILLSEESQATVLAEANPFIIKKGWFRKDFKNVSFILPDLETVDNVVISFQTPKNLGRLKIVLNGIPIFEEDINVNNPPPILIPKSLLQLRNQIQFQVWGFGLIFPREYQIDDFKVIGEITDVRKQEALNAFSVPSIEFQNIESGYLGFYPVCDQNNVGILDITFNGKNIYSAVPVCDSPGRQELFQEDFESGKNTLRFELRSGRARLEQILVKSFVKPTKGFSDFFFVEPDLFNAIVTGAAHTVLVVEFVDDGRLKEARTNINGRLDVISQREPVFIRDISPIVRDGNNFVGLEPMGDLNVMNIEVRVE